MGEDQNSLTAGERGPVLIQDMHLLEKIMHFDRERIPERVVHAKGGLGLDLKEVERLAKMPHEERAKATAKQVCAKKLF